jgi:hypothetical protein
VIAFFVQHFDAFDGQLVQSAATRYLKNKSLRRDGVDDLMAQKTVVYVDKGQRVSDDVVKTRLIKHIDKQGRRRMTLIRIRGTYFTVAVQELIGDDLLLGI